jgi:HD-GYP domain-containing protein (c-di-GMP phosphodiesterase class II)
MDALHRGSIFQFLVKPCAPDSLVLALEGAVAQYRLVTAERELLDKTLKGTIRVLIEMLSLADPVLFGKVQNLRKNLRLLARETEASDLWKLELVAMLSQIGLVTLPPPILSKMRSNMTLSEVEAKMVERIPEISHNLLVNIPRLEPVAQAVLYTQKHYDGSGFPGDNVAGAMIPLGARMLKVLTDLAQLEAEGASRAGALAMMQRRAGWYDPKIITAASSSLLNKNHDHLAAKLPCIPIAVRDLRLGDVIGADIAATDGTLLISEGHKVTATLLEKIRNFADLTGIKEPVHIVKYPSARERIAA